VKNLFIYFKSFDQIVFLLVENTKLLLFNFASFVLLCVVGTYHRSCWYSVD
jgi:hypothetical protein